MKETRPFEEYKEMIKDMSKEEMIKGLYDLSKNVIEKENEIEKITKQKEELQINGLRQETLFKLEIEKLHSIIKEVREYIKEQLCQGGERETRDLVDGYELLEILDKEGNSNE